jgi:dephospho-CoA kinase
VAFTVGLTGGAACGKSEAARRFAALGAAVVDADALAREAVAPGSAGLGQLVADFGREILDAGGALDRAAMRRRVFASPDDRRRLETIVHPEVRRLLADRLAAVGGPYAVVVVPLLVEAGLDREVDRVLVVDCPERLQIERLMRRDGEDETGARRMLAAQIPRKERLDAADDVIVNDGTLERLDERVRELHARYLEAAREKAAGR